MVDYSSAELKSRWEHMRGLVAKNSEDFLSHLTEPRKNHEINRLTNALIRYGYLNKEDICRDRDIHKKRNLGGKFARLVIANIKGDYDETVYYKYRLEVIDKEIARLMAEKEEIMGKMDAK